MVICPCVVMLPTSSRRETKIPTRKWNNPAPIPRSESKHKIYNDKFSSVAKPGLAFRSEAVNPSLNPVVEAHLPSIKSENEGICQPSIPHKEQKQKEISRPPLSFLPKRVSPQSFQSVQQNKRTPKAETLVLSNGKGKYVGTVPLKSNLNWSSLPRKETKLNYGGSSLVTSTSNRLKSPSFPKEGDVAHSNQSVKSTSQDFPLIHEANNRKENLIENYKCGVAGGESAAKLLTTAPNKFSMQTPSILERRLQFRQKATQDKLELNLRSRKENLDIPNIHQGIINYSSSSLPRVPVSRRTDPSRRASCGFQIERDNNSSVDYAFKTRFAKDIQNLKKLQRNSFIESKIPFNESGTPFPAELNRQSKFITLESPPIKEGKRSVPLFHDSITPQTSLNRKKEFYLPSVALDWKKFKETEANITKDNVVGFEIGSCEGSGEAMASNHVLSALDLEDCFEISNIEDDQKDLSKALSDIQEELMSRSDETLLDDDASINKSIPKNSNSLSSDDFESFYELPPKDFISSSPNSDNSLSPWVDDLLQESFQNLQKEVQSLNEVLDSEEEINSRMHNGSPFSALPYQRYDDEDDYIDVDCEVPPMATLRRPLGYDFLNKITGRRKEFQEPSSRYSCNVDDCKCCFNHTRNAYEQQTEVEDNDSLIAQSNFRETYWDYWLAKNKLQHLKATRECKSSEPLSVTIGKHCCAAGKVHYDPEILLAQIIHPKSLADATFSEYSSHVKSSILERLAIQEYEKRLKSDHHFGSCFDISERVNGPMAAGQNDPGYFSESDASKRRSNERRKTYDDTYYDGQVTQSTPTRHDTYSIPKLTAGIPITESPYQPFRNFRREQNTLLQGRKDLTHREEFPYSYHHYHVNTSTRDTIGDNPWVHLLPDVTPPRTPMKDSAYVDKDHQYLSSSPSITSLPAYVQKYNFDPSQHPFDNPTYKPRPTSVPPKGTKKQQTLNEWPQCAPSTSLSRDQSSKSSSTDEPNKKNRKKSFLPTFLKKIKNQNNQTSSSSTNKNDFLINPQKSSQRRKEKSASSSLSPFNNSSPKLPATKEPTNTRVGLLQNPLIKLQQKNKSNQNISQPYQKSLFRTNSELTSNSSSSSSSTKSSQDSVRTVISCSVK